MSLMVLMLAILTGPAWAAETPAVKYESVWARKRAALEAQQAKKATEPAAKAKKPAAKVKKPAKPAAPKQVNPK